MATPVIVVGHKHPDNDSIAAAVGYAYLKNQLMKRTLKTNPEAKEYTYIPARLGPLPEESESILFQYEIEPPEAIAHVHVRVQDIMSKNPVSISENASLIDAGRLLRKHNIRALVVNDEEGKYRGLITTRMIAERYISAMDTDSESTIDTLAVANDLINSLAQVVSSLTETDVLVLSPDGLLKDAIADLMGSELREAVVLDTEGYCIGIVTRSDVARQTRRRVILVDHNERSQAVNGIDEAEVMEIIDHHRIGDISTANPIRFLNYPLGSSATIVTMQFREYGVTIPEGIAAVLLSAIMTDTVILKSPTTTDVDRIQADYLADIIGEDATEFGLKVFQCRGADAELPVETLVSSDSKEFQVGDDTILIAQHETVTLQAVLNREAEIREYMSDIRERHNYDFVLLLVTDIFAEGSQFIVEGDHHKVDRIFGIDSSKSVWMPGILSRKKQVAARLLGA